MNALPILIGALCVIAIAYRYYSAFLAAKVLALDPAARVPSETHYDGHNFYPTNKWVLFGHHFAAISGAGPLIGPVLAAQFGFLPGLLWLVIGVCIGGAVQDFTILVGSVRRGGKSLAEMAFSEISPLSGVIAGVAILFIVVIALAGLGLVVVNALAESPWGTFTVATTIPLAFFMGLYMYKFRKGKIAEASALGVVGLLAAVVIGGWVSESSWAQAFLLSKQSILLWIAGYGFIASVLPVWMLLCPRDYLSSYLKIGTVAFLILGVLFVHPDLNMPAVTAFAAGGGPIKGKLFPFLFITIACGSISGFHALVASGTTPKMISRETDCRMIGYGAMLMEGVVGVVALVAATSLFPGDYFAINCAQSNPGQQAVYARMIDEYSAPGFDLHPVELDRLQQESGETNLRGRPGGAVTLAIGIAKIFDALPWFAGLMKYWYHFAIMFEALFILTTIDTGTRVGRFLVGEFLGRSVKAEFARPDWLPGSLITTALVVGGWAALISGGSISTIWPMFGIANQLLASVALCVATAMLVNAGRGRYAWTTLVPLAFVATTTLTAGYMSIRDIFLPFTTSADTAAQGWINSILTAVLMISVVIVLVDSVRYFTSAWRASVARAEA